MKNLRLELTKKINTLVDGEKLILTLWGFA